MADEPPAKAQRLDENVADLFPSSSDSKAEPSTSSAEPSTGEKAVDIEQMRKDRQMKKEEERKRMQWVSYFL